MKLNQQTIGNWTANPAVSRPVYARDALVPSIAHIGVGGFHRAHQAVYLDELCANGLKEWAIRGVGLLEQDAGMRDALMTQNCLYTVIERSAEGDDARVIGSIVDYKLAVEDLEATLASLAAAQTRIVSLTITEGGYCVDEHTGELDERHPDIVHDLANPGRPRGVYGCLLAALERRRRSGLAPFTVMSCDNVQGNGNVVCSTLLAVAELLDPGLRGWIETNGAFPNCMVDRITPATTSTERELARAHFGIEDAWPVVTEPFRQWVIEDTFVCGRPPWEDVDALLTTDVHPYEMMKIRLLNASHAAMAYLGALVGYRQVHEVMGDALFVRYLRKLMDEEVTALLPPVPGVDLDAYKDSLIERFSNPAIGDQIARLCQDGSSRQPKFIVPSIHEAMAADRRYDCLLLASASWCRYLEGTNEQGAAIEIDDAMAAALSPDARAARLDPGAFLRHRNIFGDLADEPDFVERYRAMLESLYVKGARAVLEDITAR